MSGQIDIKDPALRRNVFHHAIGRSPSIAVSSLKPFASQVGGIADTKPRLQAAPPNLVLKPVQSKEFRGLREVFLYEAIKLATTDATKWLIPFLKHVFDARELRLLKQLSKFTVSYHGVVSLHASRYIGLDDMTAGFTRPCIMDVKLGTQTYEPDASNDKKMRERSKYPQQEEFGFRLVGMRTTHDDGAKTQSRDKRYGRSLSTREAVLHMLVTFFRGADWQALSLIEQQLKGQLHWFKENDRFAFYSSSILIVYEGSGTKFATSPRVNMVDFGHVRFQDGGDPGYRHGLQTLVSMLEDLKHQRSDHPNSI